jgi:hypothetical protein
MVQNSPNITLFFDTNLSINLFEVQLDCCLTFFPYSFLGMSNMHSLVLKSNYKKFSQDYHHPQCPLL